MSVNGWSCWGIAVGIAMGLGVSVAPAHAQPPMRVDGLYPRQLPRGVTTTIFLAIPTLDAIESIDISPAAGLTVSGLTRGEEFQGNNRWWQLAVAVGRDAAPGGRTMTVRLPAGRTVSTGVVVQAHALVISGLRLVNVPTTAPPSVDVEVEATDPSGALGQAPYVWFLVSCEETPLPGTLRGTVARRGERIVVRARIPRQLPGHTLVGGVKTCEVQVRLSDASGTESNTLTTTLDVTK
jgi:hypothetical protein